VAQYPSDWSRQNERLVVKDNSLSSLVSSIKQYVFNSAPIVRILENKSNPGQCLVTIFSSDAQQPLFSVAAYDKSDDFGIYFEDISEDIFEMNNLTVFDVIKSIINGNCKKEYMYNKEMVLIATRTVIFFSNDRIFESKKYLTFFGNKSIEYTRTFNFKNLSI
jgi:hypothetical protein